MGELSRRMRPSGLEARAGNMYDSIHPSRSGHGKTHDLNRQLRVRLREVWECYSEELPGELFGERRRFRGGRDAWHLRGMRTADLLGNIGGDRGRGCHRLALVVLPKAGNEVGLVSRSMGWASARRGGVRMEMWTYGERPRFLASFLSSVTVSDSHAFVRRTVETKLRLLEGAGRRVARWRAMRSILGQVGLARQRDGVQRRRWSGVPAHSGDVTDPIFS